MRPFQRMFTHRSISRSSILLLLAVFAFWPCPKVVAASKDHLTSMDRYNVSLNAGSLEHWEQTLGPNAGIDLSHLNFYDESQGQGIDTVLDIVIFALPSSCTQLHGCDSSLVGVGVPETVFEENARMVYCCWPEAMDRDACQEEQNGRLILDSQKFVGTHKTILIPGDGMLAAFLYDTAEITNLTEGTYGLMIANCNYEEGRQIYVTGGVHWTPKVDLDTPRGDDYHTLHEQYHDGGVLDHAEYQDNPPENPEQPVVEEPSGEEPATEEPVGEEEGTIDGTVILVPPGVDGVEMVPPGADQGDGMEPLPTDDDMEDTEAPTESQIVEEPQEETNDGPGGMGAIAGVAAGMVIVAAVIMGVIYYQYQRKNQRTLSDLDLMYAMDEGGAPPSIEDIEDEALLTPRAHRNYRRPSYMDDHDPHQKQKSGYSHRPDMTHLSTRL